MLPLRVCRSSGKNPEAKITSARRYNGPETEQRYVSTVKFFATAFKIPVENLAGIAAVCVAVFKYPFYEINQLLNLPVLR